MIPVKLESEEALKEIPEDCVFCKECARHWHIETNTPICEVCSEIRETFEIDGAKNPVKTVSRW